MSEQQPFDLENTMAELGNKLKNVASGNEIRS
jgi:hypothetical protein